MPLLDHFRAPLAPRRHWESFHVNWAGAIADVLNEKLLPPGYFAEEHAQLGPRVEIDMATFAEPAAPGGGRPNGAVSAPPKAWAPPAAGWTVPAAFPDAFEVLVFEAEGGSRLVGAIELVSPANKDRGSHRRAFAVKCGSYLARGIGLIVIDVVTTRQTNLHNELVAVLGLPGTAILPEDAHLYAVGYRPIVRRGAEEIDGWPVVLHVGQAMPVLPLSLNAELCVPVDLEATYSTACRRRRLPDP